VNHAFTKSLLFFCSGHLLHGYQTKEMKKITGAFHRNPLLGTILFLAILAIVGLPPFGMFVSEFLIFSGGFAGGKFLVSLTVLFLLVVIFWGFLKHGGEMIFGVASRPVHFEKSVLMDGILVVGAIAVLTFGIWIPSPIHQLVQQATLIIEGSS
jgi:hydrogenase-4 component F